MAMAPRPGFPAKPDSEVMDKLPIELRNWIQDVQGWGEEIEKDVVEAAIPQDVDPSNKVIADFSPTDPSFPASNYAALDTRNNRPVLDFDATTQETVYFIGSVADSYASEGLVVQLFWSATSAISGTIGWDVSFEKVTGLDSDSDSFAAAQTVTAATVPSISGEVATSSVSIADGVAMGSLVAGDLFRIRVRRDVATDTATGDAELHMVQVRIQ